MESGTRVSMPPDESRQLSSPLRQPPPCVNPGPAYSPAGSKRAGVAMLQKSGWVSVMLDRVEVRPHHKGPVIDSISPADDRRDAVARTAVS